jgi:hypothetical protein
MYLNDSDISKFFHAVVEVSSKNSLFLIREPIATGNRLTIINHFSDDMEQNYNAIYRSEGEMLSLMEDSLIAGGYKVIDSGDVFSQPEFNNRSETKQRFILLRRG